MIFDGAAKYFFIEYLVSAIRKILAKQMFDVLRDEKIPKLRQQQGRACLILGMRGKCERWNVRGEMLKAVRRLRAVRPIAGSGNSWLSLKRIICLTPLRRLTDRGRARLNLFI